MGYTHGLKKIGDIDPVEYMKALEDCVKIAAKRLDILANGSGEAGTKPDIDGGEFQFNGIGRDAHETFGLPIDPKRLTSDFCKTNRKPYDDVVVACLARMAEVKGIEVTSDGFRTEWIDGVRLASKVLSRNVFIPKTIEPDPSGDEVIEPTRE